MARTANNSACPVCPCLVQDHRTLRSLFFVNIIRVQQKLCITLCVNRSPMYRCNTREQTHRDGVRQNTLSTHEWNAQKISTTELQQQHITRTLSYAMNGSSRLLCITSQQQWHSAYEIITGRGISSQATASAPCCQKRKVKICAKSLIKWPAIPSPVYTSHDAIRNGRLRYSTDLCHPVSNLYGCWLFPSPVPAALHCVPKKWAP